MSLKILLVSDNCSKKMGGEAILPYHYFRTLKKKNIDVKLLVHERNRNELEELFKEYQSDIYYIKDTKMQMFFWKMGLKLPKMISDATFFTLLYLSSNLRMKKIAKKIVKEQKIDVVHQVTPVSAKAPSFIYRVNAPVVIGPMNGGMEYPPEFKKKITFINEMFHQLGKKSGKILNFIIPGKNKAALLLTANQRTYNSLKTVVRNKNIKIEHENGVDLSLWNKSEELAEENKSEIIYTYVGRLEELKGVHFLIKSMAEVVKKYNIKLNIIGDGVERENLGNLAKELNIESNINFMGFIPQGEIPFVLKKSRALVLPSIYECGGAVVLEAMAMSKAVIATNWGGPAEYLDGSCGILVNPESEEKLIKGLEAALFKLTESKEIAELMGKNGRKKVEENFDWDKKADKIIAHYKTVAGE